jgi:hypothetical protein
MRKIAEDPQSTAVPVSGSARIGTPADQAAYKNSYFRQLWGTAPNNPFSRLYNHFADIGRATWLHNEPIHRWHGDDSMLISRLTGMGLTEDISQAGLERLRHTAAEQYASRYPKGTQQNRDAYKFIVDSGAANQDSFINTGVAPAQNKVPIPESIPKEMPLNLLLKPSSTPAALLKVEEKPLSDADNLAFTE